jgi:hypothetical protein
MKIRYRRVAIAAFVVPGLGAASVLISQRAQHSYVPPNGFVPDAATASAVAEAVLIPIYGRGRIDRERPLTAHLRDSVWIVEGQIPRDRLGGVAHVEIAKRDARILRVTHGR